MKTKKLILLPFLLFYVIYLYADNLHVGSGQLYSTIQAAVDNASEGDIIIIHQGTYREQVAIDKEGITFQPNGTDTVTVSGAEIITDWTSVGDSVYKAFVNWDVSEGDQSNQVFIDGEMIHLARWPKRPVPDAYDYVTDLELGRLEGASDEGNSMIKLIDNEYDQDNLWLGAKIWINLSNPTNHKDGQGHSAEIVSVSGNELTIESGAKVGNTNWGIDVDTRYYLFDPDPSQVKANGGVTSLLGRGEWWRDNDTLYIKTKDGKAPSTTGTGSNVVEVKKRIFGFKPSENKKVFKNITIKDINLFATSITTDVNYEGSIGLSDAQNNTIDGIHAKYISHFVDLTGNWQVQWSGRSGIILSGSNNIIVNSTLKYTAGSAISCLGMRNIIHNNLIDHCNYQATESACINFGIRNTYTYDHDIGYNTISNTPHAGITLRGIKNYLVRSKGIARIHHNIIHDCLTRIHDSGFLDGSGNYNWLRIDHNIMYNAPEFLQIGVYLDYGDSKTNDMSRMLVDHNVIYNIDRPVQMNHCNTYRIYNNTIRAANDYDGLKLNHKALNYDVYVMNNIAKNYTASNAVSLTNYYNSNWSNVVADPGFATADFQLVENSTTLTNVINQGTALTLFSDSLVNDTTDIGAYEYGKSKWHAGYYGTSLSRVAEPVFSVDEGTHSSVNLTLSTSTPGATIRYTTNGKTPTRTYGTVYTGSFNIPSSCQVKAIAFKQGLPESFLISNEYTITSARAADNVTNLAPGLNYLAHASIDPSIIDFDFLPVNPDEAGVSERVDLDATSMTNDFGMQFTGYIYIKETGEYTFYGKSDDGMQLYIGNTLVIDNTGNSNEELEKNELEGNISLEAGYHPITVDYFECDFINGGSVVDEDNPMLSVKYSGPNILKQPIPDVRLFHIDTSGTDVDPEISIIEPFDSTSIESGLEYTILAEAYDADGIDSVVFSINNSKVSQDAIAPYEYKQTFTQGDYFIHVMAYDVNGNTHADSITISAQDYDVKYIKQTHDSIVLDGVVEDAWKDDSAYHVSNVSSGTVSNSNDLSGEIKMQYSAQGLYLVAEVIDDVISIQHESDEILNNDGIELFLDLNNGKTNFYEPNDFHYILSVNGEVAEKSKDAKENVDVIANINYSGYILEAFIPWETLNYNPEHDDKIGVELKIIDSDNNDQQEGKLSWWETSKDDADISTNVFGIAMFKDFINDTISPEAPVIIGPGNGDTVTNPTPTFAWKTVSDPSGILRYELDINGTINKIEGNTTEYIPSSLLANASYTWKIRAIDKDSNTGAWSQIYALNVDDSYNDTEGPVAPGLITPYDGENLDSANPVFKWESVYDMDGIDHYEIQIGADIYNTGKKTNYQSPVLMETDSTWKVRAIDVNGNTGEWSNTRTFYLRGVTNIALDKEAFAESVESGKTSLGGANDGDYDTRWGSEFHIPTWYYIDLGKVYEINRVVIYWQTSHATVYDLQVSDDAMNWKTIYSETDGPPEHIEFTDEITGLSDSGRYIRLYAIEKDFIYGVSFWEFEVYSGIPPADTLAPNVPALLLPENGDTIGDVTPLLKWEEAIDIQSGIEKYEIEIDDTIYNAGDKNHFNIPHALPLGEYSWKIRVTDKQGNTSPWSSEYSFTIHVNDTSGPTPPALYRPLDGFVASQNPVLLKWFGAADKYGIEKYQVMVGDSIYDVSKQLETTILLDEEGSYTWKVRAFNILGNAGKWSEEWTFTLSTQNRSEKEYTNEIVISPNPVHDVLYINALNDVQDILIKDLFGRTIMSLHKRDIKFIDVSDLKNGNYIMICNTAKSSYQGMFIKE